MKTMEHVKKRIITSMVSILLLIITLFGITYAYFLSQVQGNDSESVKIGAGKLALEYSEGNGLLVGSKIKPGTTIAKKTFIVKNTGTNRVDSYKVIVENVKNELVNFKDLKYTLICKSYKSNDYAKNKEQASEFGTCSGNQGIFPKTDDYLITNSIDKNITHYYELSLVFEEANEDQSVDMNKKIEAKVNIQDGEQTTKNILIYGNSVQDGTPTPDTPVEIESVGERTKNLFDATKIKNTEITVEDNGKKIIMPLITSGNGYTDTGSRLYELCPDLKVGDTVTLNFQTTSTENKLIYSSSIGVWKIGESRTITQEMLDSKIVLYGNRYTDNETEQVTITNLQIEYGGKVTDYEPYGYKIPIKFGGKNLFNKKTVTLGKNLNANTGTLYNSSARGVSDYIEVDPTRIYTLVYNPDFKANRYINCYDKDKNFISWDECKKEVVGQFNETATISFANDKVKYIRVNFFWNESGTETEIDDFIIYEGSGNNGYEPYVEPLITNIYLNEPLRKIGDSADYIDFKSGKIIRKVKEIVLTGNEDWKLFNSSVNTDIVHQMYSEKLSLNSLSGSSAISNIAPFGVTATTRHKFDLGVYLVSNGTDIAFQLRGWSTSITVEEWKEYLKSNLLKVYYILETPIEETIELPMIPLFKGTMVVEIDTKIKPSKIDIRY